ncbi:MAG TPA: metallophosphoesterase [Myxococcota bacterium]|nr:metallophosphoesterase [Myxococcota bacterium]HRY95495.1 metallophosphoesterase [Myxococcota bacterium]HSA24014.1 metallophosphoesterase [Myxococcota bacterium]
MPTKLRPILGLLTWLSLAACAERPALTGPQLARLEAPGQVVAIGDLHGDLEAARAALRLCGAIDAQDRWVGGELVVVQTGDQLDRGDDERAILDLFDRLAGEAVAAGGAFLVLIGNHEITNASGLYKWVSPAGLAAFADFYRDDLPAEVLAAYLPEERGRAAAFLPGGAYARKLARRSVVVQVEDTVFVHGGLLPEHLRYGLGRLNDEVRAWLRGDRPMAPKLILNLNAAPTWSRRVSVPKPSKAACARLGEALDALGARRLVVGHTIQEGGISSACDGRVWRIDVGMSRVYGGPVQVLRIEGRRVEVLKDPATADRRPGHEPGPRNTAVPSP